MFGEPEGPRLGSEVGPVTVAFSSWSHTLLLIPSVDGVLNQLIAPFLFVLSRHHC